MAPLPNTGDPRIVPPTNIAQLGMGWNIVTGTIDLGLGLYDAIILVGDLIREYAKTIKKNNAKPLAQGRRRPTQPQGQRQSALNNNSKYFYFK